MFKRFLISSVVGLSILSGCASTAPVVVAPNSPQFQVIVAQNQSKAKEVAFVSTRTYLAFEKDSSKRTKQGQEANKIAKQVKEYLAKDNYTLDDVQKYADSLVAQNPDKQQLGLLLTTAIEIVKDNENINVPNLTNDTKLAVGKAIATGVADGIIAATDIFVVSK